MPLRRGFDLVRLGLGEADKLSAKPGHAVVSASKREPTLRISSLPPPPRSKP